jgi:O-antigen/teichoic acid export membrane protein
VLVALATKDLVLIAVWALIVQIASGIIYFGIIAREGVLRWQYNRRAMRSMLDFSVFSFIESVAISLYQLIDRVIVGLTLGPAAAGVYSVGSSVGTRISMVAGQISDVMVPYASLKGSLQEYPKLLDVYRLLNRFFSLFLALLSSILILWMREILKIWISPDYSNSYSQFFCVMILAYSAISLARPGLQTLDGIGKIRISALVYLTNSLIMLVGVYVLSVKYGLLGAGLANLLMLGLLLLNAVAYKVLSGAVAWKTLLADLGMGLILPGTAYLITLVSPEVMQRLLVSVLILGLIVYLGFQDQHLMNHIRLFSSQASKRVFENHEKGL